MNNLNKLIEIFNNHSEHFQRKQKELIKQFKENNPNESLPSYLKDYFDLPSALSFICSEIESIKKKIK